MLTRTQLILMTAMSTLGGSFAGLLVVGMIAGDVTLAMINLGLIIAVFSSLFTFGGKDRRKYKFYDDSTPMRRSTDLYVGGDINPELK